MSSIFQMGDLAMALQMSVTPASHTGEVRMDTQHKAGGKAGLDKAKLPALAQQSHFSSPSGAAGFLCWDVPPTEPGWQHVGPPSPGHPSVSALGFEVPEPLDMTKVSLDDEHCLAPHKEHVPPWEDDEFP